MERQKHYEETGLEMIKSMNLTYREHALVFPDMSRMQFRNLRRLDVSFPNIEVWKYSYESNRTFLRAIFGFVRVKTGTLRTLTINMFPFYTGIASDFLDMIRDLSKIEYLSLGFLLRNEQTSDLPMGEISNAIRSMKKLKTLLFRIENETKSTLTFDELLDCLNHPTSDLQELELIAGGNVLFSNREDSIANYESVFPQNLQKVAFSSMKIPSAVLDLKNIRRLEEFRLKEVDLLEPTIDALMDVEKIFPKSLHLHDKFSALDGRDISKFPLKNHETFKGLETLVISSHHKSQRGANDAPIRNVPLICKIANLNQCRSLRELVCFGVSDDFLWAITKILELSESLSSLTIRNAAYISREQWEDFFRAMMASKKIRYFKMLLNAYFTKMPLLLDYLNETKGLETFSMTIEDHHSAVNVHSLMTAVAKMNSLQWAEVLLCSSRRTLEVMRKSKFVWVKFYRHSEVLTHIYHWKYDKDLKEIEKFVIKESGDVLSAQRDRDRRSEKFYDFKKEMYLGMGHFRETMVFDEEGAKLMDIIL
ncbi:hypothetical protein HK098_006324 [Nowakowskiella sp. JEL0407]|nr:hypothetical protein HK098_006324 [Nowakowskiella sp. JEL0407]